MVVGVKALSHCYFIAILRLLHYSLNRELFFYNKTLNSNNIVLRILLLLYRLLPLMDELACRCATFINGCLDSDCDAVNSVACHGV